MAFKVKITTRQDSKLEMLKTKSRFSYITELGKKITITCFKKDNNYIYFPLLLWSELYEKFPTKNRETKRWNYSKSLLKEDDLGRDQTKVAQDAWEILSTKHSVFISASTGFGKTTLGVYHICKLGLKCVILCHVNIVKKQWLEELLKFTNLKAGISVKGINKEWDVNIMGIQQSKSIEDTESIGFVIIDEAHIAAQTAYSKSLLNFTPNYLLGLSATPERPDGLDMLLEPYFGPKEKFITRFNTRNFTVVKYVTNFTPKITFKIIQGKKRIDWNVVEESLSNCQERHVMIQKLCKEFSDKKIIIFSKRISQSVALFKLLEQDEDVDCFIKQKKGFRNSRILVCGMKKGGVGMNDTCKNMAILASDIKDVRQIEGRLRGQGGIIYDIVDQHNILENHWKLRKEWYKKRGANIIIKKYVQDNQKRLLTNTSSTKQD